MRARRAERKTTPGGPWVGGNPAVNHTFAVPKGPRADRRRGPPAPRGAPRREEEEEESPGMKPIRVAIAGVGNCASSLVQGLHFYRRHNDAAPAGLMHPEIGGYRPADLEVVAA